MRSTNTGRQSGRRTHWTTPVTPLRAAAPGFLALSRQHPPIDVCAIIEHMGTPVVERALPEVRGTIRDIADDRQPRVTAVQSRRGAVGPASALPVPAVSRAGLRPTRLR